LLADDVLTSCPTKTPAWVTEPLVAEKDLLDQIMAAGKLGREHRLHDSH